MSRPANRNIKVGSGGVSKYLDGKKLARVANNVSCFSFPDCPDEPN